MRPAHRACELLVVSVPTGSFSSSPATNRYGDAIDRHCRQPSCLAVISRDRQRQLIVGGRIAM
jgi:hypothetical protein